MTGDEVRNRRLRGFAAYGALERLPDAGRCGGARCRDRVGLRDCRRLRFHRGDAGGDVLHAGGAMGHRRRDAAAAARARQAAGEGPDVHRPQALRRRGEGGRAGRPHRSRREARGDGGRDRAGHLQGVRRRAAPGQALRSTRASSSIRAARWRSRCSPSRRTLRRTTGARAWPASRARHEAVDTSWTPRTLAELVAERARTRGDAEALVTATARWSYRAQHDAVRRTAKAMHALGVRRGDFVGILMGNDENWVSLFYAAAMLGAVTVPVNTRFKSAELAFCLRQADVKALFMADRFLNIDFLVVPAHGRARRRPRAAGRSVAAAASRGRDRRRGSEGRPELGRFSRARRVASRTSSSIGSPRRSAGRSPAHPVHVRHHRLPEGCDAHPRQHAAQRLGGRPADGDSAPTTATSIAGRSSMSPAPRCRSWSRSSPAPAW